MSFLCPECGNSQFGASGVTAEEGSGTIHCHNYKPPRPPHVNPIPCRWSAPYGPLPYPDGLGPDMYAAMTAGVGRTEVATLVGYDAGSAPSKPQDPLDTETNLTAATYPAKYTASATYGLFTEMIIDRHRQGNTLAEVRTLCTTKVDELVADVSRNTNRDFLITKMEEDLKNAYGKRYVAPS